MKATRQSNGEHVTHTHTHGQRCRKLAVSCLIRWNCCDAWNDLGIFRFCVFVCVCVDKTICCPNHYAHFLKSPMTGAIGHGSEWECEAIQSSNHWWFVARLWLRWCEQPSTWWNAFYIMSMPCSAWRKTKSRHRTIVRMLTWTFYRFFCLARDHSVSPTDTENIYEYMLWLSNIRNKTNIKRSNRHATRHRCGLRQIQVLFYFNSRVFRSFEFVMPHNHNSIMFSRFISFIVALLFSRMLSANEKIPLAS